MTDYVQNLSKGSVCVSESRGLHHTAFITNAAEKAVCRVPAGSGCTDGHLSQNVDLQKQLSSGYSK